MGPILFLIYVNDSKNCTNLNILCFADDTTAYKSGPNIDDLISNVNTQLELLYTWLCCNTLSLNRNKTSYTVFRPQSNVHHNLNNSLFINHEAITSGNSQSLAVEEGAGRKRAGVITSQSGPTNPLLRLRPYCTQLAGVERTDEELHHDTPLRLLAELRDQGKARQGKARQGKARQGKARQLNRRKSQLKRDCKVFRYLHR